MPGSQGAIFTRPSATRRRIVPSERTLVGRGSLMPPECGIDSGRRAIERRVNALTRVSSPAVAGEPMVRRTERKRAEQAAEMRAEIVEAAFAEFAARGYHQTAVADIAGRMGVSPGTFYNYFKNKRDILEHVVDGLVEQVMTALTVENAPDVPTTLDEYRDQALRIGRAVDAILGADPRIAWMLMFESTSVDRELTDRVLGLFDLSGQLAKATLSNGVERGFFRQDLDAAATADAITGMIMGNTIRAIRSRLGPEERRAMADAAVRLVMDGVRAA
jgi:AcrR family transcriptional regulator